MRRGELIETWPGGLDREPQQFRFIRKDEKNRSRQPLLPPL
jgi:hypothetical protein